MAQQRDSYHAQTEPSRRECNDVFFLVVFLGVFIMTLFFAGSYGPALVTATQLQDATGSTGFKMVMQYVTYCGLLAIAVSLAWIVIMMFLGEFLIWATLAILIAASAAAAVFFTKELHDRNIQYYWWPAVVFGTLSLLLLLYAVCIRNRVKFAAKHLKVAGCALFRLPMTMGAGVIMAGVQFAWGITWVAGAFGVAHHRNYIIVNETCKNQATIDQCTINIQWGALLGTMVGMLLVFYWGASVIKNIVAVTVSGTVASWKTNAAAPCLTLSAWLRAVTLNLGSICFGSLIVAILETIEALLNMVSSAAAQSGNCVAACLVGCISCIIGCIRSWVETFNRFAYAYIGIHGYSFVTAGHHVSELFAAKGWTAIVNDDLTGKVFFLGNIAVGLLTAWFGMSLVNRPGHEVEFPGLKDPQYIVGFGAFLVGFIVNNVLMSLMASAVTTIFVLWAEDPMGWQLTQPEHYAELHAAWLEIYPDEYNNGYGKGPAPGAV
ncbi:PNS1-like protein [Achlya hypogyna]|uniref:Choline transporter-like protein n=1 Tax=Achlya hypogyna TaxID=1202772 RepID=A0A1V9ZPL9_ACHHY|nr:PNS1-like protein [Achlya hypogyna]